MSATGREGGAQVTGIAVVSGGGTGMGKAIAARLAADGHGVVIVGRRSGVLEATAAELNEAAALNGLPAGTVSWHAADLTRPEDVERVAARVGGPVDVLVNNAGGVASRGMPMAELADVAGAWEAEYQSNVISAVLLTHALGSRLAQARREGSQHQLHRRAARRRRGLLGG